MTVELKHLRTLVALHHHGNLAQAAEVLCLTQSALSHQIKELESRLNLELFSRHGRKLKLTHAGEKLLSLANQVLPSVDATLFELRRMVNGDTGRLHIVVECHSCFDWLIPTLDDYRGRHPQIELDLTLAHSFDPLPALRRAEIDAVITSDRIEDAELVFFPLFRYQALLIVAPQHRFATHTQIAPADLQDETLITYPVARERLDIFKYFLTPAGVQPAIERHIELTALIIQLVASQRGVAALPDWAAHTPIQAGQVRGIPLGPNGMWGTLFCAVRAQQANAAYVREFVVTARATASRVLSGVEIAMD